LRNINKFPLALPSFPCYNTNIETKGISKEFYASFPKKSE
jgi:hypothetical protein